MLRKFNNIRSLSQMARKKGKKNFETKQRWRSYEFYKKRIATSLYTPRAENEQSPSKWFDAPKVKLLAKAHEVMANKTRLTVKVSKKDGDKLAAVKKEFQYKQVN